MQCGCDCTQHEDEQQAAVREHHEADAALKRTDLRAWRMRNAARIVAEAEAAGEFVQETNIDPIRGAELSSCGACGNCPGFVVRYCTSLAHISDVMMWCAACGCGCEAHSVDAAWDEAERARQQQEEYFTQQRQDARRREAARARDQALGCTTADPERARALRMLGLRDGAGSREVAKAYKRLALRHHPDKQPKAASKDARARAARRFVEVTHAYRSLEAMLEADVAAAAAEPRSMASRHR